MTKNNGTKVIDEVIDVINDEATADATALAEVTSNETQLATRSDAGGIGSFNIGPATIQFEWVKMAYGVGNQPRSAVPGEYWLGKNWDCKLCERDGTFDAVVISVVTGYKDWPAVYDPNVKLQYYANRAAAVAAGKRVEWADGPNGTRLGPEAAPYLQLKLLVKKTPTVEDDSLFTIPLGGEFYAPAIMSFEKMNYQDAYNVIARALQSDMLRHANVEGYRPTLLDKVFRIGHEDRVSGGGKRFTNLTIRTAVDDGKPVQLSKEARADLDNLIKIATATVDEEDMPF